MKRVWNSLITPLCCQKILSLFSSSGFFLRRMIYSCREKSLPTCWWHMAQLRSFPLYCKAWCRKTVFHETHLRTDVLHPITSVKTGLTNRSLLNLFAELWYRVSSRTRPRPSAYTKWLGKLVSMRSPRRVDDSIGSEARVAFASPDSQKEQSSRTWYFSKVFFENLSSNESKVLGDATRDSALYIYFVYVHIHPTQSKFVSSSKVFLQEVLICPNFKI